MQGIDRLEYNKKIKKKEGSFKVYAEERYDKRIAAD